MKVLLVDDYRVTTDLLADVACSMGHSVTTAYSGEKHWRRQTVNGRLI